MTITRVAFALFLSGCMQAHVQPAYVDLWTANAPQVCAESEHREYPVPHAHIRVFADARGPILVGDLIRISVGGAALYTFRADVGIVTLDFPGGLGVHVIVADWLGSDLGVKHHAETVVSVWRCEP